MHRHITLLQSALYICGCGGARQPMSRKVSVCVCVCVAVAAQEYHTSERHKDLFVPAPSTAAKNVSEGFANNLLPINVHGDIHSAKPNPRLVGPDATG